jgi:hypothetical protein
MKNFFFLFALLFFFCSCKEGNVGIIKNNQSLFPLAVGNQWVYGVTEYRSDGSAKGTESDTVLIVGSTTYQGNTAYQMTQKHADTVLLYNSGSNLYSVERGRVSLALHQMIAGEQFIILDTVINGFIEKEILIMKSSSETVSVLAGNFLSCVHYDMIELSGTLASALDTSSVRKQWFAPGVGQVKEGDYGLDQNRKLFLVNSVELQSYQLK